MHKTGSCEFGELIAVIHDTSQKPQALYEERKFLVPVGSSTPEKRYLPTASTRIQTRLTCFEVASYLDFATPLMRVAFGFSFVIFIGRARLIHAAIAFNLIGDLVAFPVLPALVSVIDLFRAAAHYGQWDYQGKTKGKKGESHVDSLLSVVCPVSAMRVDISGL